jgi:hypothetical protein
VTGNDRNTTGHRDAALLAALASGMTIAAAAREAKIGEATARRRMADPAFRLELEAVQARALDEAVSRIGGAAGAAVDTLLGLLDDAQPVGIRLGASQTILRVAVKLHDNRLANIEARLDAIERGEARA